MTLQPQKMEITDRVIGKLKNGSIELYLENEPIGKVNLPEGSQIELTNHFEVDEQQRIYQHYTSITEPEARYTDCDEGGWC